jgi:cyclopropane fatty-acyl-phospholipid synthase-like methyltransferase
VLAELRACDGKRVLEIGSGRGYCSLFLAGAAPDAEVVGVDLVPRHVAVATEQARTAGLDNVEFLLEDATKLGEDRGSGASALRPGSFDVVFGVEALCHMDTPEAAGRVSRAVASLLRPGGRFVIVDGFRSESFSACSEAQRTAMCLAESGFRIRAMPSQQLWIDACAAEGMAVARRQDLTHEALPFWELGWRVARAALLAPGLIRWFVNSSPARRETGANFLSVATTAHAMRARGSAEYGLLVLAKP